MTTNVIQPRDGHYDPRCHARHTGIWLADPRWLIPMVEQYRAGTLPTIEVLTPRAGDTEGALLYTLENSVAVVPIAGQMVKGDSKYGGTNSVRTRQAIRVAVDDQRVKAIMLHVDSPGGTVAGTPELADEIARADTVKPVHAHIDDLGASAAYWVSAQARRVTANATAEVGSIGTMAVVHDTSQAAETSGVQVHVVASAPAKGAFVAGAPVLPEHLEELKERVMDLHEHFVRAVARGRDHLSIQAVRGLADGRTHMAADAQRMGLIDAVQPFSKSLSALQGRFAGRPRRNAALARLRICEA